MTCTYDALGGSVYNYFRDYDPATGRYPQSDPIGLESGTNTYAYVYSNPISYLDPFGLWRVKGPHVPDPKTVDVLSYVFMNCVQRCYGAAWELIVTATTTCRTNIATPRRTPPGRTYMRSWTAAEVVHPAPVATLDRRTASLARRPWRIIYEILLSLSDDSSRVAGSLC